MIPRSISGSLRVLLAAAPLLAGCFTVDNPPTPAVVGLVDGVLTNTAAPFVVAFSEPVVPSSLRMRIVRYELDVEGNLYDADADPDTQLDVLFDSADGTGGTATLDEARTTATVTLAAPPPIGPQLALVIDPGLRDDAGNTWKVRQVIKFGYQFSCADGKPTTFPTLGKFFWLITVDKPVPAQIQLLSEMRVTPETGEFVIQMTNGERNRDIDCGQFGLTCKSTEVCRTLPMPKCVPPSEKAGSPDEYVDYFADATSDVGFSFTIRGCIQDQPDGTYAFANQPAEAITKKPAVVVSGINLSTSWKKDEDGFLRGAGTFTAEQVGLGAPPNTVSSGKGTGSHAERQIPDDFALPIPSPPAE
ncbi:MAG: hypothetical protein FJ096_21065 [Deltaproteobacteria bacterium]|nr:hypothetical protein [Deltaproteobacteria bacterium]